jgi:surfeit locus 1 family protein
MSERVSPLGETASGETPQTENNNIFLQMFSRRWILATVLVVIAMGVFVRLGIWQLDRLEKRRAFNTRVSAQLGQPTLELTGNYTNLNLNQMEYRSVIVRGVYDHSHEVALRNQIWANQPGVHLLTPLKIEGTDTYIMVNRGWVPVDDFESNDWSAYNEPGMVEVRGMIRASQSKPDYGGRTDPTPAPGEGPLTIWNFTNVERISEQVPYALLPVYIQQAPDASWTEMPNRSLPKLELTEGPHQSYAMQWFAFAVLLGVGYPLFIRRRQRVTPIK